MNKINPESKDNKERLTYQQVKQRMGNDPKGVDRAGLIVVEAYVVDSYFREEKSQEMRAKFEQEIRQAKTTDDLMELGESYGIIFPGDFGDEIFMTYCRNNNIELLSD